MDGDTADGEQEAPEQTADQGLAQHSPGGLEIVGSDEVGHLYGESHVGRRGQSAHQPGGGLDESDGRRGLLAEMTDHRSVDEEHDGSRELCQDAGDTQVDDKPELVAPGHRPAFADVGQQLFATFCHADCLRVDG